MVFVSVDFYVLVIVFVVFGMVMVLIDFGMGFGNILWVLCYCGVRVLFSVLSII